MNPSNPLLNRLYEKKSSKGKRNHSIKDQLSNRDKVLVPKLVPKSGVELIANTTHSDKQKTMLIKPALAKLPPLPERDLHKDIVIQSEKKTTFRDRKVSWNTTHEIPTFATELNFSAPSNEYEDKQEEPVKLIQRKQSKKKFKTVAAEPNNKGQEQLFQYLKVLQKNEQLKEQFCYMNRSELPYSYEIVSYDDVNKNQFLTVSLRGVSIYKDGESQFTTAQKLSRQIELYRKVKKIQFFSQYILMKTIKHWRFRSVRRKFQSQCKHIAKILLNQNPILQTYYHFLFNLKQDFNKCKFLDIRFSSTGDLHLLQTELKQKQSTIQKSLDYFENAIQKNLKEIIEKNMNKFKKQQRVSLTSDGKDLGQQSFLPYDSKKKSMKYTQIAKLKQFQAAMYQLLKMSDLVRFTTKTNMVKDGLQNYAFQLNTLHEKFLSRKQKTFVSWIHLKIQITKPKNGPSVFTCTPTISQIEQVLRNHLKSILQKFYRKHYLLIDKKNQFFCESYDPPIQQFPSKLEFKYYVETNKQFIDLKQQCEAKLNLCLKDIRSHLEEVEQSLLSIYDESFMTQNVNTYMENEALRSYLVSQAKSRQIIANAEQIIEFGLVYFDIREAIVTVKQKFEQKFKYISNAIPSQVVKRCQALADRIKAIYNTFKQNPSTVLQFISFVKNYNQQKKNIAQLEKKIQGILELEQMVYKNGLRIGESSKLYINQCTTYFRELEKRFEQIQGNQEKQRKKFYKTIDDMVEPLDLKAQQLYKAIYEDDIISKSDSDITKCIQKLADFEKQFLRIKQKKQQLFYYQSELKLGHKDIPNYFKLQSNLQWIIKLWNGRKKYNQFLIHVKTKGQAEKSNLSIADLKQFIRDIDMASSEVEYIQLLQNFKQDALRVLNILQVCRLLSADTLQQEHKNMIRQKLVTDNKRIRDYLFLIEGGRTIICSQLVQQTNILEIKHELEEVVHASAQQSIIKKNIQEIEEYWKKHKIILVSGDLAKNGVDILHFGRLQNQKLQQKVGSYLMAFKSILGSRHAAGQLNSKVAQQIQICEYLKKFIEKWVEVEREWIKLLPLMTNCPSVKHQSNVYFEFTSLDTSIRKHNRQMAELMSLKKVVQDYKQKRYLILMQNIEQDLRQVNKIFTTFLEIKRNTYHRFFFLADQELINILENTKDAKSLAKYAGYCFNCDQLLLDKELVSGFETATEIFKLKKVILKGEPDEMFKSVQQNMKTSLKFSISSLIPKMKIGMNIEQEHENTLQAVLVADRFLWTEMTELYLNPSSYQSYQLFLRRPCEQLTKFMRKTDISPQYRHKISVRLVQAMGFRETGEEMIKLQVTKQDFKWKEQRKYTIEEQQIVITQFNRKFTYGLEYYPPSKITVPTQNYKLLLNQTYETSLGEKVLLVTGVQGDGKRNLTLACAREYGCYYKELVCNKNISAQYVLRFVQGAVMAGAWLSLYQFEHLEGKVLVKLLNQIKKVVNKIKMIQRGEIVEQSLGTSGNIQYVSSGQTPITKVPFSTFPSPISDRTVIRTTNRVMFNFITHGFYPQKVSVYQFDTFALSEPNHKKVCDWLLQVNNFSDWENLSTRLVVFLQTIFPFLQRVMGSFMSILRKVIDTACNKKKNYSHRHKENDILAETFKQQILEKSDENIHQILYQALHTYFYFQIPQQITLTRGLSSGSKARRLKRKSSLSIDSKLTVLCALVKKKISSILVIGPRSNKSTLIKDAGQALGRQIMSIYPQATDEFFQDETIQKLNKLQQHQIIHYDGESIIREWNDLVISGYLLLEGKKIHLSNQLIIELRAVSNCSPSFVGSCQIVYIGNSLSRRQKFEQLSGAKECELIMEPLTQIFGLELENMPEHLVEPFAAFLKPYAEDPRSKNYHKLIVWFGTVLGIDGLWNRYYGGRFHDVTVNKYSQQLVIIDESKYPPIEQKVYSDAGTKNNFTMGNLLIHTKWTILYYELFKNLVSVSMPVLLTGKYDTGKSTLIKLLLSSLKNQSSISSSPSKPSQSDTQSFQPHSPDQHLTTQQQEQEQEPDMVSTQITHISLPVKQPTKQWTKILKSSLTNIRREGKNYLMNIGKCDIIIAVDDLDLGFQSHREYLRQAIDLHSVHDSRFEEYSIQKIKVISAWHKQNLNEPINHPKTLSSTDRSFSNKLFDRMLQLQIPEFTKQSLSTILRTNIDTFTRKNNMSKEVVSIIDTHLLKSLLIIFDDVTNVSGSNLAATIVLAAMRNLLSLPRKNVLMGGESYVNYFKMQLKARMMEKCFTSKTLWQYNSILQNLNKVVLNTLAFKPQPLPSSLSAVNSSQLNIDSSSASQSQQSTLLYSQGQFKPASLSKLKQKITQSFPQLYIFDEMLRVIVLLNNQMHLIDSNSILVGRSGTGKVTILKVVASLNKIQICEEKHDLTNCILKCLKGQTVILLQVYLRRDFSRFIDNSKGTLYQKLIQCSNDDDLLRLIVGQQNKKQYNSLVSEIPNRQGSENDTKVLSKVLNKLKSVIIFDTLIKYKEATNRFRQLNRYFVCYIDQWPAEALLNISGVNIPKGQILQMQSQMQLMPIEGSSPTQKGNQSQDKDLDLSKLLAQAFTTTNKIMLYFQEPSISIKKFKTFLSIFEILYKIRNKQLTEKVQFYTKVYQKFYDACSLITEWERRVDILKIQLEQSIKKLDQQLNSNRVESVTFSLLHSLRQIQEQKIIEKNEEMSAIKRQMEKKLQGMKKMMQNISKIVNSMQRTEMSELKKIYKSSRIVSFGLECLCMLLGQDPIQKSVNKILADPNLMMKMKVPSLLQTRNAKVIQKFKNEFDGIKSEYESKSKSQASRVLIDWIKAILDYWIILGQHQVLNYSYKSHKKQYDESLKKQAEIEKSIDELKQNLIKLNQNYGSLFAKKQQDTKQFNSISIKIRNAKQLLPALKKSEQQTWEVIKQLRENLSGLVGNLILATTCLIYLPLKRLKLKKYVLDEIKKLLNAKLVQFNQDFMNLICRSQDAVLEDLNLVAMKQLEDYPVLIVDPERRAMSYLFDHDPLLATSVITATFSDLSSSADILNQIQKHGAKHGHGQQNNSMTQSHVLVEQNAEKPLKQIINLDESQRLDPNQYLQEHAHEHTINNDEYEDNEIDNKDHNMHSSVKYIRKNSILHTTQQSYRNLLQKLPQNTFVIDWKYTTINTNEKIFLRIASKKKPQYFQAKRQLNRKIKKNLHKIQHYKRNIYQSICQKQIKILDDEQFVDLGTKLLALQIQTEQSKKIEKQKLEQIKQYAKQINEEVTKVIYMVNSLKKIRNIALDLVLDIACSDSNTLQNIIKWAMATLQPKRRIGWLLSLLFDYTNESNQQLFSILIKDMPMKISEIARNKKPVTLSTKNYENACKIAGYTLNLKTFSDCVLRSPKQFEVWTLDPITDQISPLFKPQILSVLQQLVVLKVFKPKILLPRIKKHLKQVLKIPKISFQLTHKQLLMQSSKKYPIIAHCTLNQLEQLCTELNFGKICVKSMIEISDGLELKRFVWAQMAQGNWVVLHSVYDRQSRQMLQDIVEYVANYQEQESFRIFVLPDQVQLTGHQNANQITTSYNNVSDQASNNRKNTRTAEMSLVLGSKYIQNIGISMYQELPSFKKLLLQSYSRFNMELPEVTIETAQQNPINASFLVPQTPLTRTIVQKPGTPTVVTTLMPALINTAIGFLTSDKEKHYFEKIVLYINISLVAAWVKFSKLRMRKIKGKVQSLVAYIKQYYIPMEFNLYALANYLGKVLSSPLDTPERMDVQQLMDRIFDETKINDKQIYGVPTFKQSIALAIAGIGRGGMQIDKNWIDEKVLNNYQLLGCEESYQTNKNAEIVQSALNVLGQIRFFNRPIKEEAAQIRLALARLPSTPVVFSREIKNTLYLHCYMNELKVHNANLAAAKQFMEWVNLSSNQDFKEDEVQISKPTQQISSSTGSGTVDMFNWTNLKDKIRKLIGLQAPQHKIRATLTNWLQIMKRKHEFLLYWNMDNAVHVFHPALFVNFSMVVSTYIINYLSANYSKIKQESESTNQNILYTLQIQFSRQTDQKQLYMTEGILLPDLIYKQFRYNFEYRMVDGLQEWTGEEPAPLIMLKMKKVPPNSKDQPGAQEKDNEDYKPPSIQIAARMNNQVEIVYKIDTYIDGNFQQWGLRRPMLISQ